jgi:hypothetical protein
MRVRARDANVDMVFGAGPATFLVNSPEAVLQCVLTALKLFQGEFFLDTTKGMPWNTDVLGFETQSLYDTAIQNCIRGVVGVTGIAAYSSTFDKSTRYLSVTATIQTQFGDAILSTTLLFAPPQQGGYGVGPMAQNPYGE